MERKFKIGDKVKVVKNVDTNGKADKYIGRIGIIIDYLEDSYLLDIDRKFFKWYDDELELAKESIFDKLAHSITEAAKEANILVEPTEDGGIKISPLEVKEEDLPIDTPVMVSNHTDNWYLRYYAGNKKVLIPGREDTAYWHYIIEYSKFNPNSIEESLKYNIVK